MWEHFIWREKKKKKKRVPMHNSEKTTALALQWIGDRKAAGSKDPISPSHPLCILQSFDCAEKDATAMWRRICANTLQEQVRSISWKSLKCYLRKYFTVQLFKSTKKGTIDFNTVLLCLYWFFFFFFIYKKVAMPVATVSAFQQYSEMWCTMSIIYHAHAHTNSSMQ